MMKRFIVPALAAGIALAAAPVATQAQVNGMAVAEAAVAVAGSQPLQNGFQQVGTTYQAQITALEQYQTQRQQLLQQLDTNGDGSLDEAEQAALENASNPVVQQLAALEQNINTTQTPIQMARLYVVSQVAAQYGAAVQQVISDRQIQILLAPEAIVYAPDAANVTELVSQAINTRVPSVSITPPQGWQPTQATINLYQQIQQVFAIARAQQEQAAAAQAPAATSGAQVGGR
jgi:Skp family chaperone for outer membrane proteins